MLSIPYQGESQKFILDVKMFDKDLWESDIILEQDIDITSQVIALFNGSKNQVSREYKKLGIKGNTENYKSSLTITLTK